MIVTALVLIAIGGIDLIRQFQSNEGMTLMDSRDKFETHQYSFSGLDDILSQFAEQISGAVGIPLVRRVGRTVGLNPHELPLVQTLMSQAGQVRLPGRGYDDD